jgi:hypothetical protein
MAAASSLSAVRGYREALGISEFRVADAGDSGESAASEQGVEQFVPAAVDL